MSERENKPDKVEDLETPITDKNADQVKGGTSNIGASVPVRVKQINPKASPPCI